MYLKLTITLGFMQRVCPSKEVQDVEATNAILHSLHILAKSTTSCNSVGYKIALGFKPLCQELGSLEYFSNSISSSGESPMMSLV